MTMTITSQQPVVTSSMQGVAPNTGMSILGEGASMSISQLMMLMRKLNTDMRDTLREFHDGMQKTVFDKLVTSFETKQGAIESTYKAALVGGISQMVSGVIGMGGAAMGGQATMLATGGLSKATESIGGLGAAEGNRDAQQAQLLGEFQTGIADVFEKTVNKAAERAAEASRQLRDTTRELVALHDRMMNAVQIGGR